jgi:hypothetical protein
LRVAEIRRNGALQHVGRDRLGDAEVDGFLEARDVDGEQDIGGGIVALGLDALLQPVLGEDHVDGDAGLAGELVEQRLDEAGSR